MVEGCGAMARVKWSSSGSTQTGCESGARRRFRSTTAGIVASIVVGRDNNSTWQKYGEALILRFYKSGSEKAGMINILIKYIF